ncbi:hypothetical protein [Demequina sediminicola]|uniref:hypothetical protein n=1 Tax=Demequina sediminicola TaxID=1095026 RepID=UPI000784A020|nr:hypothetical protein [Demequina sediminicola]
MKNRRYAALAAGVGIAAGAAFVVGAATSPSLGEPTGVPSPEAGDARVKDDSAFPMNASHETYGSAADAASPEQEPDLILVVATNGKLGYVRAAELNKASGADIDNAEDAATWQEERLASGRGASNMVPVYDKEGRTVIGQFAATS